jgi:hypothetical protein
MRASLGRNRSRIAVVIRSNSVVDRVIPKILSNHSRVIHIKYKRAFEIKSNTGSAKGHKCCKKSTSGTRRTRWVAPESENPGRFDGALLDVTLSPNARGDYEKQRGPGGLLLQEQRSV